MPERPWNVKLSASSCTDTSPKAVQVSCGDGVTGYVDKSSTNLLKYIKVKVTFKNGRQTFLTLQDPPTGTDLTGLLNDDGDRLKPARNSRWLAKKIHRFRKGVPNFGFNVVGIDVVDYGFDDSTNL